MADFILSDLGAYGVRGVLSLFFRFYFILTLVCHTHRCRHPFTNEKFWQMYLVSEIQLGPFPLDFKPSNAPSDIFSRGVSAVMLTLPFQSSRHWRKCDNLKNNQSLIFISLWQLSQCADLHDRSSLFILFLSIFLCRLSLMFTVNIGGHWVLYHHYGF